MNEQHRAGTVIGILICLGVAFIAMEFNGCCVCRGTKQDARCGQWQEQGNGVKCRNCKDSAECVGPVPSPVKQGTI